MTKIFLIVGIIFLLFFSTILNAQQPQMPVGDLKGKYDRITGEVKLSKGALAGKKVALEDALATLEKQGYTEEGLDRLKTILSNTYQGGEDITNEKPSQYDGVLEIIEEVPHIKFRLASEDLSKYTSFDAIFTELTPVLG